MPAITSYSKDETVVNLDKLIGTDSVTGHTKNFWLQDLRTYFSALVVKAESDGVLYIVKLTQAEYDGLTPDPNTQYLIVG